MESQRLGDYIVCNPTVKLKKGQQCQLTDIDSITIGQKYPISKGLVIYDGQSGSKFSKGDTIMARITPCLENGKIAMYNGEEDSIGSTELFVFRGKEGVSTNEFVYYFFKQDWIRYYAANSMTGASGRQRADIKFIQKAKVQFPPLATQQKISSILSAYDTQIENNQKRIKLLEQMAENLYKEWFVRFRFPGYETAEFEGGVPKGWEYKPLGEIASFERGLSYSSEEIDCEDGLNLVNLKNIEAFGGYRRDGLKHYNGKYKTAQVVKKGDLVMGVTDMTQDRRTVGAVALIPEIQGTSVISADLVKIVSKQPNLFLYCLCRFGNYSKFFSQFANGANVLHLKPNTLLNKKVLMPTDHLIKMFVENVQASIECIDNLYKQNDFLTHQRDLLLPRLISGKLSI